MKYFWLFLTLSSSSLFAAPVSVPSLKSCEKLHNTVQSVNGEAFQMDLSPEEASIETLKNFASCSSETTTIDTSSIACHAYRGYLEICAVPSDRGQFLIVKDHVDGASIHVFPDTKIQSLKFSSQTTFSVPNAEACYTELLRLDSEEPGSRDHRNLWIENQLGFKDMRQASASALRKIRGELNLRCDMPLETQSWKTDECVLLNGIQSCFLAGANGYFITARSEWKRLAVGFYRWD